MKADEPIEDPQNTSFLLASMPPDWRVMIDSHSSSPIFADENSQLVFQALKMGVVTPDYVLDNMPFPNKEMAKVQLREKEKNKAEQMKQLMQANPEVADKLLQKEVGLKR